ncbi:hypothetical protein, partial [Chromobacterium alticapitis]
PRRLALPTYPFAQERYWVAPRLAGGAASTRTAPPPRTGFDQDFFARLLRDIDEDSLSVEAAVAAAHRKILVD